MLFTCLWHAFLRDLNDPPVTDPQRSYLSPRLYPEGAGVAVILVEAVVLILIANMG